VDGVVGPQTRPALVALMRMLKATWYGPGFYGKRTACGVVLRPTTVGVAHRTVPCGTRVTFYHAGRFLTLPVIDRGPFRRGVEWALTAAAARRLGFLATGRLRYLR
jgi:rare lipoprotein A